MNNESNLKIDLQIPFPTNRLAEIAYDVLRVEAEPKRSGVVKKLFVEDNVLKAEFSGALARQLRVAINSFFDNVNLITETFQFAGPPASEVYSFY